MSLYIKVVKYFKQQTHKIIVCSFLKFFCPLISYVVSITSPSDNVPVLADHDDYVMFLLSTLKIKFPLISFISPLKTVMRKSNLLHDEQPNNAKQFLQDVVSASRYFQIQKQRRMQPEGKLEQKRVERPNVGGVFFVFELVVYHEY